MGRRPRLEIALREQSARVLRALFVAALFAAATPTIAFAQCPETRAKRPLFFAGAGGSHATILRWSIGARIGW